MSAWQSFDSWIQTKCWGTQETLNMQQKPGHKIDTKIQEPVFKKLRYGHIWFNFLSVSFTGCVENKFLLFPSTIWFKQTTCSPENCNL